MKRVLWLFMVFIFILSPIVPAFAEDEEFEEEERKDLIDEFIFEVSDKKVVKQEDKHAIVSFVITNPTNEYYPEIYYTPYLHVLIDNEEFYTSQRYIEYTPVKFDLYANESKTITYDLSFPERLPKMKYVAGFGFEVKEHTLSLADEIIFLDEINGEYNGFLVPTNDTRLKLGEDIYLADIGPNINSESAPKGLIEVKSTFDYSKKVIPQFTVYRRSVVSNNVPVSTSYGEAIVINPGETKEISLDLPVIKIPEAYLIKVTFVDESMIRVSPQYEFRYVVEGVSANIGIIKAKQSDKTIEVTATVLGPADTSTLKDAIVLCEVENAGNIIASKETKVELKTEFYNVNLVLENINIEKSTTAKLKVKILYDGKIVAEKDQDIKLIATIPGVTQLEDIKGTKYEEAVTTLNSLGILNGYPDGTFKPENTITRAEFASIATKLGKYKLETGEESKFSDVVGEHWAKDYINTCSSKGIVSGYLDGTFKPNNNVNYSEAITMLLNILEYKSSVNNSRFSWPENYLRKSTELGIHNSNDYTDFSLPATRGDIAILTYNAYLRR